MGFLDCFKIGCELEAQGRSPKSVTLKGVSLDAGPVKIDWKTAKELAEDEVLIARMVVDLFIEHRVLYAELRQESPEPCKASLENLHLKARSFTEKFEGSSSPKDKFMAQLILWFQLNARRAIQALEEAEKSEEEDRSSWRSGGLIESDDIITVEDRLASILFEFRMKCYPLIHTLIAILPQSSPCGAEARRTMNQAQRVILECYSGDGLALQPPTWELDFQ